MRTALLLTLIHLVIVTPGGAAETGGTAIDRQSPAGQQETTHPAAVGELAKSCPRIAFVKRNGYGMRGTNATMFAQRTAAGSEVCVIDLANPETSTTIFQTNNGFILDLSPSYDGRKLLMSYKVAQDQPFHVWEIHADGSGLRQITDGPYHDVTPVYYPDGRIVFSSSRAESYSMCQDYLASALHICDADGSNLRRIDFTTLNSSAPSVLSDGRILFTRWEYQDKNIFSWQGLWTLRPDGRQLQLYYGNTLTVPNSLYGAKEIPGTRNALFTMAAHHHPPIGDIAVVNPALGTENTGAARQLTHATDYQITQGRDWRDTNWQPGDRIFPNSFVDPFPVSPDHSLVSDGRTGKFIVSLLSHETGEVRPVHPSSEGFSAVPLGPRKPPRAIAGECPQEPGVGTFFVQDIYQGLLRQGVNRGQVKHLRVMQPLPKKYNTEGPRYHDHYPVVGQGSYYVKVNHGTVPVAPNGSAHFRAPSNVELYFQALDEAGKEIIRMGSVTQITTGESVSCIGCHDSRQQAPPLHPPDRARLRAKPDEITPPPWGAGGVDYVRQVQPVLDRWCLDCHSGPLPKAGINLTGDKTRFYNASYESLVFRNHVDHYFINPGPTGNFPALSTGSWTSNLTKLIEAKHAGVDVDPHGRRRIYAWIDANVPYFGTWEMTRPHSQGGRDAAVIPVADGRPDFAPWVGRFQETVARLGLPIGLDDLNYTHPDHTPALVRLLAESAGGLAADHSARFKTRTDPDYRQILGILNEARDTLLEHPRIDMGGKPIPQNRDFGRVF